MKKTLAVTAVLLAVMLTIAGCSQPIESTARDGIASASGFLNQEVAVNRDKCIAAPSLQKCVAIKKASQTLSVAIDTLEAFCGSPAFNLGNAPCTPPTDANIKQQLIDKLTAVLTDLNRDINDVKAITAYIEPMPRPEAPAEPIRAGFTGGGILALIGILLPLLKGLLNTATGSGLPGEIIDAIEAAITALEKIHGTPVTREQLESLKVEVPW
jgi:hypothetical protein